MVLLCAGKSSRFGEKKQLVEINGFPLFLHTLMRFSKAEFSQIVLVAPSDDVDFFHRVLNGFDGRLKKNQNDDDRKWWEHHKGRISCIAGGLHRWSSSVKAIEHLEHLRKTKDKRREVETVIIHDGARPLLDGDDLERLLAKWRAIFKPMDASAKEDAPVEKLSNASMHSREKKINLKKDCRGLVACYQLVDTIKRVEKIEGELFIKEHPRRSDYVAVATPQIFDFAALKKSYEQAALSGFAKDDEPTDDAEVVGKYFSIALCLLDNPNPKLTYPHQFDVFQKALSQ